MKATVIPSHRRQPEWRSCGVRLLFFFFFVGLLSIARAMVLRYFWIGLESKPPIWMGLSRGLPKNNIKTWMDFTPPTPRGWAGRLSPSCTEFWSGRSSRIQTSKSAQAAPISAQFASPTESTRSYRNASRQTLSPFYSKMVRNHTISLGNLLFLLSTPDFEVHRNHSLPFLFLSIFPQVFSFFSVWCRFIVGLVPRVWYN